MFSLHEKLLNDWLTYRLKSLSKPLWKPELLEHKFSMTGCKLQANTLRFMTGVFFLLQSHPKNKFPCNLSVKMNIGILKTVSGQDQLVINVNFFIVLWIYLLWYCWYDHEKLWKRYDTMEPFSLRNWVFNLKKKRIKVGWTS